MRRRSIRSEEHTSELQSRFGISYAVFCLKKKKIKRTYSYRRSTDGTRREPRTHGTALSQRSPLWLRHLPSPAPSLFMSRFFFLKTRRPPRSALFPHPTLFR